MALHDDPAPPSKLADRADTSLQNAQYHLGKLEDAGAVEVIDTAYSEKGREMDIYAPADRPLVLFAGREEQSRGLREALTDLLTGVAGIALGAVVVQELFGRSVTSLVGGLGASGGGGQGGDVGSAGGSVPSSTPTETALPTRSPSGGGGGGGPGIMEATPTATPGPADGTPLATGTPQATAAPATTGAPTAADTATRTATDVATTAAASGDLGLPPGLLFFLGGLLALLLVVLVAQVR
jgi:DNA-binding transcriptional ArsR family regulator